MPRRSTKRRFWLLFAVVLAGAMLFVAATPAAATVRPLQWHRHNIYEPLGPSHERLRCLTGDQWLICKYDTVPEPKLGFSDPDVRGTFVGRDVTRTWECPEADWFPSDICESATRAFSGVQTFYDPGSGEVFSVDVVFIVTDDGALWNYWVDQFVCPWYPTFKEALNSPADCFFNE